MQGLRLKKTIAAFVSVSLGTAFASTQPPSSSAASVNPANVNWDLENQLYTTTRKIVNFQMTPSTQLTPEMPSAERHAFTLKKVTFKYVGEHVPTPPEVKVIYKQALNHSVNLEDLQNLAQQMQQAYRDLGYILIQVVVPPQVIDPVKGEVTFEIIEGQIQSVKFTGDNPRAARTQLERYAKAIENENPITYQTIDRFLTLANNLPGIDVQATLIPDPAVPGGADLVINVKELKQSVFANFNNHQTPYMGPGQVLGGFSIYDIFAADSLSVSGATSTSAFKQLKYISGSYSIVTGPYSTNINPTFSATQTQPGGTLTPFEMLGNSSKFTLNVNQPLVASSTQNFTLNFSAYHLTSENFVFSNVENYDDKITALTAGFTYQGVLLRSVNSIDAYTTVGLPILGAPATLSTPSRANGKTQFIMLNFDTSTTHYFTQHLNFNLATTGQVTPMPLLVEEQIGYGGMTFGQAYIPYIISGDNGVMGSFALRYDITPFSVFNVIQPEVFYDAGVVGNNQALVGTLSGASASSAGVGLNVTLLHDFQVNLTLAKPLRLTQVSNTTNYGWEGFINMTAVF